MQQDMIVILDLGSQENTMVARAVRELGVYSEIKPHDITAAELKELPKSKITIISCCISILLSAIKFYTSLDILIVTYLTPASPLNYCRKLN